MTIVLQLEHIEQVYLAIVLEFRHFDVKNMTQKEGRHPPGAARVDVTKQRSSQLTEPLKIDMPTVPQGLHGELQKSHAHHL